MSAGKILIVEDNEKNMKLFRDLLNSCGYATLESVTAEDGIRLAEEEKPALVLMDIQLPGMNGIDALKVLKSNPATKEIPVVAVSASAMTTEEEKIRDAGFDGYQRKPIEIDEFLEEVKRFMGACGGG